MPRRRGAETVLSLFAFQDIITGVTGVLVLIMLLMAVQLTDAQSSGGGEDSERVIEQIKAKIATLAPEKSRLSRELAQLSETLAPEMGLDVSGVLSDPAKDLIAMSDAARRQEDENDEKRIRIEGVERVLRALENARIDRETAEEQARMKLENTEDPSARRVYNASAIDKRNVWLVELRPNDVLFGTTRSSLALHRIQGEPPNRAKPVVGWIRAKPRNSHFVVLLRPGTEYEYSDIERELLSANVSFGFDLVPEGVEVLRGDLP